MRPEALAALHAAAFAPARSWSAAEFDSFLADPACLLVARPEGFALARVTLDEAELLTIATDPARRRQGVADRVVSLDAVPGAVPVHEATQPVVPGV